MAPMTSQDFVAKWRASMLKGRLAAQEHFIDLCRMLGHATPAEADPAGTSFTLKPASQSSRAARAGPRDEC